MYQMCGKFLLTILLLSSFQGLSQAKFPDDPKPCKYGDGPCIANLINYFVREQYSGDESIDLLEIDPLKVKKINIKQGAESAVNIDLTFSNNDIHGFKDITTLKVKGFNENFTGKHHIYLKLKKVILLSDYKIDGKVLILPIKGTGRSNITLVDTDLGMHFTGTSYEKDNEKYMNIENMKLTVKPKRVYYKFENLFNGDKLLGDNMNAFLNENWSDIFAEVRDSMTNAFGKIFTDIMNRVFAKYSYEKFFSNA